MTAAGGLSSAPRLDRRLHGAQDGDRACRGLASEGGRRQGVGTVSDCGDECGRERISGAGAVHLVHRPSVHGHRIGTCRPINDQRAGASAGLADHGALTGEILDSEIEGGELTFRREQDVSRAGETRHSLTQLSVCVSSYVRVQRKPTAALEHSHGSGLDGLSESAAETERRS